MVRYLFALLLTAGVVIKIAGCAPKPPDTSTFPSPYTYPTEGLPPEKEEPR